MEQNSCRITTEIQLYIASMQFKQIPEEYDIQFGTGFVLPFTINVGGNGMVHKGKWIYEKTYCEMTKSKELSMTKSGKLYCFMENVKYLKIIEKPDDINPPMESDSDGKLKVVTESDTGFVTSNCDL